MRAFLATKVGTGTRADPFRPSVDFSLYPGESWAGWDIEHPDTDEVIGYICVWTGNVAPIGGIDLGDPTDKVSMRTTTISNAAAQQIADLVGINANRVRNRTGVQIIKFLNRTQPVMSAEWGDAIADLIDETDTG